MNEQLRNDAIIILGRYFAELFLDGYGERPDRDTGHGLVETAISTAWGGVWRLLEVENEEQLFKLFSAAFDAAAFAEDH